MQDSNNDASSEATTAAEEAGPDVAATFQEAADAVARMDPNRIMEFLSNNGLDSSTFVALG